MIRVTFWSAAETARTLIASPAVAQLWEQPSVLREMTVGDLAGHLARGAFTVEQYLGAPAPTGVGTIMACTYFNAANLTRTSTTTSTRRSAADPRRVGLTVTSRSWSASTARS